MSKGREPGLDYISQRATLTFAIAGRLERGADDAFHLVDPVPESASACQGVGGPEPVEAVLRNAQGVDIGRVTLSEKMAWS